MLRRIQRRPRARGTELYDVEADPDELRNVAGLPIHRETVTDMQRRLRQLVAEGAPRE